MAMGCLYWRWGGAQGRSRAEAGQEQGRSRAGTGHLIGIRREEEDSTDMRGLHFQSGEMNMWLAAAR